MVYGLVGLLLCVFIITIPFGIQYFKFALFVIAPFGKTVVYTGGVGKAVLNTIYAIFLGWESALVLALVGVIACILIITIPVGIQMFKACRFAIFPLGSKFVKIESSATKSSN